MYRLAIVGAGLLSIAGFVNAASAADLPAQIYTKAPPPPAAVYNWTGFYAGLHVGGDYINATTSAVGGNSSGSGQTNRFLGGILGGYNWQTGPWVFGVEGDWSSIAYLGNPNLFTLRGRAGFAYNNLLFYLTGGVGTVDYHFGRIILGIGEVQPMQQRATGPVAGVGIEARLPHNFGLRAEGLYFDGGTQRYDFPAGVFNGALFPAGSFDNRRQNAIYRASLIYSFN